MNLLESEVKTVLANSFIEIHKEFTSQYDSAQRVQGILGAIEEVIKSDSELPKQVTDRGVQSFMAGLAKRKADNLLLLIILRTQLDELNGILGKQFDDKDSSRDAAGIWTPKGLYIKMANGFYRLAGTYSQQEKGGLLTYEQVIALRGEKSEHTDR